MAKYVPDIGSHRWVIISPARSSRPDQSVKPPSEKPSAYPTCPFCPGNEAITPPEVYRIGGGEKDKPGWSIRVVPNKFPITDIHEVIIHSPDDEKDVDVLPLDQVTQVMTAYRDRYRAHEADGQVLLFCNHGFSAGASLKHPHSQLVVVPSQINLDAVSIEPFQNIVEENTYYLTYCPDFSQWPLEVWIAPKLVGSKFGDVSDKELPDLAQVLQRALKKISMLLQSPKVPLKQANEPFVFNYYIYHGINWFIRIIPRAIHRAGFELGTGLNVNVIDPTDAAKLLQEVKI
jgi:UDPglucose--hexose-1-phosphate uridylyltransferase